MLTVRVGHANTLLRRFTSGVDFIESVFNILKYIFGHFLSLLSSINFMSGEVVIFQNLLTYLLEVEVSQFLLQYRSRFSIRCSLVLV